MEWQPIETAPKDGTEIDIWMVSYMGNAERVTNAYWHKGQWVTEDNELTPWPAGTYQTSVATHWMPLPEPPN